MLKHFVSIETCFLCSFIYGLGDLHADQMFRTAAEVRGGGFDVVKHVETPAPVI